MYITVITYMHSRNPYIRQVVIPGISRLPVLGRVASTLSVRDVASMRLSTADGQTALDLVQRSRGRLKREEEQTIRHF